MRGLRIWEYSLARIAARFAQRIQNGGVDALTPEERLLAVITVRCTLNYAARTNVLDIPQIRQVALAAGILEIALPAAAGGVAC